MFPQRSFADQVRSIEALQGRVPETISFEVIIIEEMGVQLSVAVATPVVGGLVLLLHCWFNGPGQVITGFITSVKDMIWQAESVHPAVLAVRQTR